MMLTDFKVLTFDCYGTLIDWESGIWMALRPLVARAAPGPSREAALAAFARHESAQEAETPALLYPEILRRVHRRLAAEWEVTTSDDESGAFGASVGDWPVFPDSAEALDYLQRFFQLVILSNVDRASFARSRERLGTAFAAVFTAEDIGSYKPDLRNFHYMLEALQRDGYEPGQVLHTAQSLFHDHAPANALGLHSVWIDRRRGAPGSGATMPVAGQTHYDFRFTTLAEMVEAHRAELRG